MGGKKFISVSNNKNEEAKKKLTVSTPCAPVNNARIDPAGPTGYPTVPSEYTRLTTVIKGLESQMAHDRKIVEETGKDMRATDPPTIPARVNYSNSLAAMHVTQGALLDAYARLSRLDERTPHPIMNGAESNVSSNRARPPVTHDGIQPKEEKTSTSVASEIDDDGYIDGFLLDPTQRETTPTATTPTAISPSTPSTAKSVSTREQPVAKPVATPPASTPPSPVPPLPPAPATPSTPQTDNPMASNKTTIKRNETDSPRTISRRTIAAAASLFLPDPVMRHRPGGRQMTEGKSKIRTGSKSGLECPALTLSEYPCRGTDSGHVNHPVAENASCPNENNASKKATHKEAPPSPAVPTTGNLNPPEEQDDGYIDGWLLDKLHHSKIIWTITKITARIFI